MPGRSRHANKESIQTDADKKELVLTKRIFDSENYRKCIRIAVKTRNWLNSRAVPSPLKEGTYLIPLALLDSVEAKLQETISEYKEAVAEFIAEYPQLIEQWKEKLGSHFDASNYPSPESMKKRFSIERMVLNFSPARPDEINQSAEIEQAIVEIKAALRAGLLGLVQKLAGMLGERKDGKKRGFQDQALDGFKEWMELLPARLVVDDKELMKLAERATKLLAGKSADDFRDMDDVRVQVKSGLEKVGERLEGLLKYMPTRAFGFDE
jgi:hypothetical protein